MEEKMQKFWELENELNNLTYYWTLVIASQWTKKEWKNQHEAYDRILVKMKILASVILKNLYIELETLEKLPKIIKSAFFPFILPKKIEREVRRYNVIKREVQILERYLQKNFYEAISSDIKKG